jgi:lipoate-protein ligase B
MSVALPPVIVHFFKKPLPYTSTWNLQERIHNIQLALRKTNLHPDVLLLLQHRPVYTAGRRQTEPTLQEERNRLQKLGADFVSSSRGGQLTYHGPGQVVGYPLIDLARYTPTIGTRDYVCRMQHMLKHYLRESHDIPSIESEHAGVFLDWTTKIGSIGVQVRHRMTSHGFAINITKEPLAWFNKVVACGLDDVRAGSVESRVGKGVVVDDEIPAIIQQFGKSFDREMVMMDPWKEGEIGTAIIALEKEAEDIGGWARTPKASIS